MTESVGSAVRGEDCCHVVILLMGCDSEPGARMTGLLTVVIEQVFHIEQEQVFDVKPEQVFTTGGVSCATFQTSVRRAGPMSGPARSSGVTMNTSTSGATPRRSGTHVPAIEAPLTERQLDVLKFIEKTVRERGYPPSVREICAAVGLTSPSSVHNHLETLQRLGHLRKDPSKPRAIEVRYDTASGTTADRSPVRHVPLIGDVAAGTGVLANEHVEELVPLPADLTGEGELFMLRVRGDSMIEAGIFDGDFVVVRAEQTAENGDIVVAGIPGEEATVKTFRRKGDKIVLVPSNASLSPMVFQPDDIAIYGKVVTVLRKL